MPAPSALRAAPASLTSLLTFFSGCALLLAGAGCGKPATPSAGSNAPTAAPGATPLTKVILQTDWYAQPEHGGFYQAVAKGFYRDAGLDVEIRQGSPSTRPQQVVASGQAAFSIGRSDEIIVYTSRGIPLQMLGALMQRDPQAIMFHQESGIRSFKDLDGRNLMAVPGSNFIPIMQSVFQIKVSITPSDYGMTRFLADKNFVQQCFITNEPYYVAKQGANVGTLLLSESGFAPYRVWYTTRKFAAENPALVRAFTAASIRGWRDYLDGDRTAANARIAALNPKMDPEFMEFSLRTMKQHLLVTGDPAAGEAVGQIRPDRIQKLIDQLSRIGVLDRAVTVDEIFDPTVLPAP